MRTTPLVTTLVDVRISRALDGEFNSPPSPPSRPLNPPFGGFCFVSHTRPSVDHLTSAGRDKSTGDAPFVLTGTSRPLVEMYGARAESIASTNRSRPASPRGVPAVAGRPRLGGEVRADRDQRGQAVGLGASSAPANAAERPLPRASPCCGRAAPADHGGQAHRRRQIVRPANLSSAGARIAAASTTRRPTMLASSNPRGGSASTRRVPRCGATTP